MVAEDLQGLNLQEQIYHAAAGRQSRYLLQSRVVSGVWELALWLRPNPNDHSATQATQEPNNQTGLALWTGIGEVSFEVR